jgi:flagellar L-ring protein precursor FlgH
MGKRNVILAAAATAMAGLGAGAARAQSERTADPASGAPRPPNTQMMMQSSGGSLLQASLPALSPMTAGASGLSGSKVPAYSFYAVPQPEPRVMRKHDLVSIVVQESSTYTANGDADLEHSADFNAEVDQWVRLNLASLSLHGTAQANNPVQTKLQGQRDLKNTAQVDRSDTVTLRLEGEVIDVKPNGTLVVQARKHIKNDEEEQTITLTGTCRVQDVDASNSLLSTDLHDLDLQKVTKGAVRDNTKRGLLPRLLDFINPF